jgi:hypothetical protein
MLEVKHLEEALIKKPIKILMKWAQAKLWHIDQI